MATENVNITLEEETIKKVRELARKETRSFSNMIQRILEEYFSAAEKRIGNNGK